MNQKGSALLVIMISVFLLLGVGGLLYFYYASSPIPAETDLTSLPSEELSETDNSSATPEAAPDYNVVKEKYNLTESQLEILSRVDSTRL